jgi:hypothetical protein
MVKKRPHRIDVVLNLFERLAGIEPASSAWKAEVIAIIRQTHDKTNLLIDRLREIK